MTVPEEPFLAGLMDAFLERFVARLKDEGLVHDDRPLLDLGQAATRLNVSMTVLRDMIRSQDGQPPVLATVKVIPGGHKGIMVEPAEIDRHLEQQRRATWIAVMEKARRDTP